MLPSLPPAAASTGDTSTRAKAKSKAKAKPKPSKSKATSSSVKQQGLTASQATHNPHHQRPWSLRPSPAKAPPPGSRSPAPPSSSLIPAVHHQLSSRGSHQQPEVPSSASADAAMSILQHLNSPHSLTSYMSPPTETPSSSSRHLAGQTRKRGLHSRKDEIDMATFLLLSPEEQVRQRCTSMATSTNEPMRYKHPLKHFAEAASILRYFGTDFSRFTIGSLLM
mmetsp:Transcript_15562/g.39633  ORF Transcript_15562/g.39633 Transcript_15562/m.39633 type:complete len:223 (+) Transcript_15562:1217-1885(+)